MNCRSSSESLRMEYLMPLLLGLLVLGVGLLVQRPNLALVGRRKSRVRILTGGRHFHHHGLVDHGADLAKERR